ncbi:indolepyruvate oxidoreductase subunit beta [Anaerotardibacter muris]|uniref:indolepyruvate oxidoreductase subunit beta n=1 Tax=Anaerotardibacter muris TaxID=2941505 RepID=UPI00203F8C4A|nr:indolepyruvate oxidoreductase subunit beta [Anaerotardibacter muris]
MSESQTYTILLCGVGGQGTITAADLLARVASAAGKCCKVSEIHGMAQRGGAVTTVVRFGDKVSTMVCDEGCANNIVSFEITEALRNLAFLAEDGVLVVNDEEIKPLPVLTGKASMPAHARERLVEMGATLIPAGALAREAGTAKCANVVLLGALAPSLPFEFKIWEDVIRENVPPKTIDINIEAFRLGVAYAQGE